MKIAFFFLFAASAFAYRDDDLQLLQRQIRACPEALEFLENEVRPQYNGRIRIEFRSMKEIGWSAKCSTRNGSIEIARELDSDETLLAALFELANLSQRDAFNSLHRNKCFLDVYAYGRAVETLEYESSKITDRLIKKCQARRVWSSGLRLHDFTNLNECLCTQEDEHTPRIWATHIEECGARRIKKPQICDREEFYATTRMKLDPFLAESNSRLNGNSFFSGFTDFNSRPNIDEVFAEASTNMEKLFDGFRARMKTRR